MCNRNIRGFYFTFHFFKKKENVLKEENVLYVFWFFCWHWLKTLIDI